MKKSVYIETTIPSYITARDSREFLKLSRQIIARDFWDNHRQEYSLYTSDYVIDECQKGDAELAKKRLDLMAGIPRLPVSDKVEPLALIYKELLQIPEKATLDAYHLAISVLNEIDYVVSWNFKHMGIPSRNKLLLYNNAHDMKTPELVPPDIMLELEEVQNARL